MGILPRLREEEEQRAEVKTIHRCVKTARANPAKPPREADYFKVSNPMPCIHVPSPKRGRLKSSSRPPSVHKIISSSVTRFHVCIYPSLSTSAPPVPTASNPKFRQFNFPNSTSQAQQAESPPHIQTSSTCKPPNTNNVPHPKPKVKTSCCDHLTAVQP